jgi:acetyl esterase/lipase
MLIYPAYLANKEQTALQPEVAVPTDAPPVFFVHAFDDPVTPMSSILLFSELKRKNVPAELHVFPAGGHGYGLRPTAQPITHWPALAETWLRGLGVLSPAASSPPAPAGS